MWRHFDEPAARSAAPESRPTQSLSGERRARAARRRHELLLIPRAAAVRIELLEIAALIRCSPDPDPNCIADLYTLLTSGCDSPLYNPGVPAEQLRATLDRARAMLTAPPVAPITSFSHQEPKGRPGPTGRSEGRRSGPVGSPLRTPAHIGRQPRDTSDAVGPNRGSGMSSHGTQHHARTLSGSVTRASPGATAV